MAGDSHINMFDQELPQADTAPRKASMPAVFAAPYTQQELPLNAYQDYRSAQMNPEVGVLGTFLDIDYAPDAKFRVRSCRQLHGELEVGCDFTSWVKRRIAQFQFVESVDFEIGSPDLGNQTGRGGDRRSKDYRCTLQMARRLCMAEGTDRGKQLQDYFIQCESKLIDIILSPLTALAPPQSYLEALKQLVISTEANEALLLENKALGFQIVETIGVAEKQVADKDREIDLLIREFRPSTRHVTLAQFAKMTASVLGYSKSTIYDYLVDAKIIARSTDQWGQTIYTPYGDYDRSGFFHTKHQNILRPVVDPVTGEKTGEITKIPTRTLYLTVDRTSFGELIAVGGQTWLFGKMMRSPGCTIAKMGAGNGASKGPMGPLYGALLTQVMDRDSLRVGEWAHNRVLWYQAGKGVNARFEVSRHIPSGILSPARMRIAQFQFVEGVDFEAYEGSSVPDPERSNSRPRTTKEYRCTPEDQAHVHGRRHCTRQAVAGLLLPVRDEADRERAGGIR